MRIDNWPLDRIMRLPDWCFGRRWPVGLFAQGEVGADAWDIAEVALPERCVLWEVVFWTQMPWALNDYFRLALGHQLPTTIAMMSSLDPLLHGVGARGPEPRDMVLNAFTTVAITRLRHVVESSGRRPILEVTPSGETIINMHVVLVFSSIPREVPDWLASAQAINLS